MTCYNTETHLHDLYLLNSPYALLIAFKPAFRLISCGEEHQDLKLKIFKSGSSKLQLERENLMGLIQDLSSSTQTQSKEFLASKRVQQWSSEPGGNKTSKTSRALQSQDVQINPVQAVDDKSSRTKSDKHDTSSNLRTYITHDVDADIRLVNDQVPFAEVDSNTTPDSTNMCHRGGEIDQDAEHDQVKSPLLKAEFLKTNDMVEKEVYNELSNRFTT
ncbi:hypothetical protein Tco_0842576 [Tanacetum coccineum]|uniref:Uncharacterized protein n=1 Tax=Tanacetum coccineum TaxID=301880 RepID=A0ABQ5B407_9ASTR